MLFSALMSSTMWPVVSNLREPHHAIAFGAVQLQRMRGLIEWMRQAPVAGSNVADEVQTFAMAACSGGSYDEQRVYELLGIRTGDGVGMCYKNGEVKIVARAIDLAVRMVARRDQAAYCAARIGDLMIDLHRFCFADAKTAMEAERSHQTKIAQAIAASGQAPFGPHVLAPVPEYARGPLNPRAQASVGKPWHESFGPGAASFAEEEWEDPFDDSTLEDGRDPKTTRTGNVEGWD